MSSIWTVALREYRAAVQTRAFLVSLALVPLMLVVSFSLQQFAVSSEASTRKVFAVVDRTAQLRPALDAANLVPGEGKAEAPTYAMTFIEPSADAPAAVAEQRLALSERRQAGEFEGILEIGPDVFEIGPPNGRREVRYQTEKLLEGEFGRWATRAITNAVRERRFLDTHGLSSGPVRAIMVPVPLQLKGPTVRDPSTGEIVDAPGSNGVATYLFPVIIVVAMFGLVLFGAIPAMQGVVEEKQQRIAEVLLGCIAPFELMLGKLLGMVGVSLTLLGFYSVGGGIAASRYGVAALLSPALVGWFALFVVLAALMYGSIFLAVGAAASDMKETQALQLPIVLLATAPIMLVRAIVRNPTGKIAIIGSFFPFSAPMLMSARLAMANPVPWWHPAVASLGVLASALFCVWAAGRIFRIGLLLQGTSVRWTDLGRWILGRER